MTPPSTGVIILAGGLARRMGGGDKSRQRIAGQSILARTIACLTPQTQTLALNVNGDPARFADILLPIIPDSLPGHPGPLAGILTGLDWAATLDLPWLVSVPSDCPFLPPDLIPRLHQARDEQNATFACAASGSRTHPVIALWPTALREELRAALRSGQRKIDAYTARHTLAIATWSTTPHDPFFNINTPEDLAEANRLVTTPSPTAPTAGAPQTPQPG